MTLEEAVNGVVRKWAHAEEKDPAGRAGDWATPCDLCRFVGNPDAKPPGCAECPVVTTFGPDEQGGVGCFDIIRYDWVTPSDVLMSVLFLAAALDVEVNP